MFRADTGSYEAGVTPLTFAVKRSNPSLDIEIKLDGYKSGQKTVTTETDQALFVSLEKEAAPAVAAAATPATGTRHHEHNKPPSSGDKPARPAKPAPKDDNNGGGDDMRLLQPKF